MRTEPLIANGGVARYEVRRISNARNHKGQSELWVDRWRLYRLWSVEDFIFVTVNAIWTVGVDACAVRQGKHTCKYCSDLGDLRSVIMHTNNNKMYQHF